MRLVFGRGLRDILNSIMYENLSFLPPRREKCVTRNALFIRSPLFT